MIEIKMPRLSDTMEEGAISTWRKRPGDTVAVGDVLVEIETDKAVMEYEAYQAGTLAEILVAEGQNADIGAPIALLDDGAGLDGTGSPAASVPAGSAPEPSPERMEPALSPPPSSARTASPSAAPAPGVSASPAANGTADGASASGGVNGGGGHQFASPLVRKLARENHLDLSHVTGSGPGGRIIRADLNDLLAAGTQASAASAGAAASAVADAPAPGAPGVAPASASSAHPAATAASATPAASAASAASSATVNDIVNSSPVSAGGPGTTGGDPGLEALREPAAEVTEVKNDEVMIQADEREVRS